MFTCVEELLAMGTEYRVVTRHIRPPTVYYPLRENHRLTPRSEEKERVPVSGDTETECSNVPEYHALHHDLQVDNRLTDEGDLILHDIRSTTRGGCICYAGGLEHFDELLGGLYACAW